MFEVGTVVILKSEDVPNIAELHKMVIISIDRESEAEVAYWADDGYLQRAYIPWGCLAVVKPFSNHTIAFDNK